MAPLVHVNILGDIRLTKPDGTPIPLEPAPALLLGRLLMGGGRAKAYELKDALQANPRRRSQGPITPAQVQVAASAIRTTLRAHGIEMPDIDRREDVYTLPLEGFRVDAWDFEKGVDELDDPPDPAAVNELLTLWRGDPAHASRHDHRWRGVLTARRRLIETAGRILRDGTELDAWLRFAEIFSGEPGVRSALPDPPAAPRRVKRLLIVEDKIGHELKERMLRDYDCTVIESFDGWLDLVERSRRDPELIRFDGALVDRHLKWIDEDNDGEDDGFRILEDLRDYGIPSVLMTAYAPLHDQGYWLERYGLAGIYIKDNNNAPRIRHTVRRLLRETPDG
jgi:CheY-like chemotaxis protein